MPLDLPWVPGGDYSGAVATVQPPSAEAARKRLVHAVLMTMQPSSQRLAQLAELLDAGTTRTVVTKTYPLAQARDAWAEHLSGHTRGKVVLEVLA